LGFDLLIIFFDDPNDDASHWIDCHEDKVFWILLQCVVLGSRSIISLCVMQVLVLRNDETLRCRQMKMSVYHSLKPYLDTEVQARQQLNAETGLFTSHFSSSNVVDFYFCYSLQHLKYVSNEELRGLFTLISMSYFMWSTVIWRNISSTFC
jgi:hypothetical protein